MPPRSRRVERRWAPSVRRSASLPSSAAARKTIGPTVRVTGTLKRVVGTHPIPELRDMAQVERSDSWTTSLAADRVGSVIEEFAARTRMRVTRPSPNTFAMNDGSNPRARAFGVWFESSSLPSKASVETSAAPGGTRLSVRIEETWPNYLEAKSRSQYAALFDQWMQALREAIPALSNDPGIQGEEPRPQPPLTDRLRNSARSRRARHPGRDGSHSGFSTEAIGLRCSAASVDSELRDSAGSQRPDVGEPQSGYPLVSAAVGGPERRPLDRE